MAAVSGDHVLLHTRLPQATIASSNRTTTTTAAAVSVSRLLETSVSGHQKNVGQRWNCEKWQLNSISSSRSGGAFAFQSGAFLLQQMGRAPGSWRRGGEPVVTAGGVVFAVASSGGDFGQDPEWREDDYIVLGLAHCFRKDDLGKLKDVFVVEPVTAGTLECMENGGVTCYVHTTATTLGVALQRDVSLLPVEFRNAEIAEEFDFRAKCASRTWKRDHPQQHLLHLVPKDGGVRSDFNFSLDDKRVLNAEVVVNDSDNIKQDMSIDVYGRQKEEEIQDEISQLYSA
jgi:phosphatidylinositol glycan class S